MQRTGFLILYLLLGCIIPGVAHADTDWSTIFSPPETDMSIEYLTQIFGTMGSTLVSQDVNAFLGSLFFIFNIAVIMLGAIVAAYTVIISVVNTAQEGELLGKKTSLMTPLRAVLGMGLLMPTVSGYSLVQILMMKCVLLGVGAADVVWGAVVESMMSGTGVAGSVQFDPNQMQSISGNILQSMMCMQIMNTDAACQQNLGNQQVSLYNSNNTVFVGVPNNPTYANVCGSFTAGSLPTGVDQNQWNSGSVFATTSAMSNVDLYITQGENSQFPAGWSDNAILNIQSSLQNGLAIIPPQSAVASNQPSLLAQSMLSSIPAAGPLLNDIYCSVTKLCSDPTAFAQGAKATGWLFAGSYYFSLINPSMSRDLTYYPPVYSSQQSPPLSPVCITHKNQFLNNYTGPPPLANSTAANGIQLSLDVTPAPETPFMNASDIITESARNTTTQILLSLTNSDPNGDPMVSLRNAGSTIMITAEAMWFSFLAIALLILVGACIMSAEQPFCYGAGLVMAFAIPAISAVLLLFWAAGAMVGIYLPMVPFILFTFGALSWFLLVVEAIVAAPIVALGFTSPGSELLGRASPTVMILTDVMLRPTLMVLGFIVSIKLVRALVTMINYGFFATVQNVVHGIGVFGLIVLIYLYCGLLMTVVHQGFSLIYILPDKILRWIGGDAQESGAKKHLEEAQKATEKGGEVAAAGMKAVSEQAGKSSKKLAEGSKGAGAGGGEDEDEDEE